MSNYKHRTSIPYIVAARAGGRLERSRDSMGCGASTTKPGAYAPSSAEPTVNKAAPAALTSSTTSAGGSAPPQPQPASTFVNHGPEPSPWEDVRALGLASSWPDGKATALLPAASASRSLCVGDSVSLKGISGHPELDGTGATLLEAVDGGSSWSVQPEMRDSVPITVPAQTMSPLPPLPTLGVSVACLRSFRAAHAEFFESGGQSGTGATTAEVCFEGVKPLTQNARTSLALCLLQLGVRRPLEPSAMPTPTASPQTCPPPLLP